MMSNSLLDVARLLFDADGVTDAHLARSISTSYYAVFQHFCEKTSTFMLGDKQTILTRAREHLERSVEHTPLAKRCKSAKNPDTGFPEAIVDYARAIGELQAERHIADYNRAHNFTREDAERCYNQAKAAIEGFNACDEKHQRAFVVWANFDKKYG